MWWSEDNYNRVDDIPPEFGQYAGPHGIALVRVFPNGKTDAGWGESTFMTKYMKQGFHPNRAVPMQSSLRSQPPFAFVMRSLQLVCVDIDGKNGGFEEATKLTEWGLLPETLAETSKSSNGYHLFYRTGEDQWHAGTGFAEFKDKIAFRDGIDIRATGCVFHWPNQRWNHLPVAELPDGMKNMLRVNPHLINVGEWKIATTLEEGDMDRIAMMKADLAAELEKDIPAGRRNNTLFAIGSQMMLAGMPEWDELVDNRARAVGLDLEERKKLIKNIEKYGANA